jgi:hypothetical protein
MNKVLGLLLVATVLFGSSPYKGSTTAAVVLSGGIIKSTHIEMPDKKYERKNCPVCKGTGKYLSGDGIKMVDCGYCEPEKKDAQIQPNSQPKTVIQHPPIQLQSIPQCNGPNCKFKIQQYNQ